jgi:hypothetical protein
MGMATLPRSQIPKPPVFNRFSGKSPLYDRCTTRPYCRSTSGEVSSVLQTPTHDEPTVLCLEGINSHFAASQQIFDYCEVIAATNTASALVARLEKRF